MGVLKAGNLSQSRCGQDCFSQIREMARAKWRNHEVEILSSVAGCVVGIVLLATQVFFGLALFLVAAGVLALSYHFLRPVEIVDRSKTSPYGRLVPISESNNLDQLKVSSDPFDIQKISIDPAGKYIEIDVSYTAGNKGHEFNLYCSSALRFDDRKDHSERVFLHHNSNQEPAEALARVKLKIDLTHQESLLAYHILNWAHKLKAGLEN